MCLKPFQNFKDQNLEIKQNLKLDSNKLCRHNRDLIDQKFRKRETCNTSC